jgi:signal transduction histidine kinase
MLAAPAKPEDLAARLGHDLRNPLNGLCAALEVLQAQPPANPVAAEALAIAARQASKLVAVVDELLPRS